MNKIYPFTSPIIMNDTIFVQGGGSLDHTTTSQRNVAYFVSEKMTSNYINTLLLPHEVTGTYYWELTYPYLLPDWGYINSVRQIRFINTKEEAYHTIAGTANVEASIRDRERGIIDIHQIFGNCQGCVSSVNPAPYQVEVVYTPGLPTGTATQLDFLLGLSIYADMILNEIVGWGNEAPGLVGLKNFRNQSYGESRIALEKTDFGSSARAQLVKRLFSDIKRLRWIRLR